MVSHGNRQPTPGLSAAPEPVAGTLTSRAFAVLASASPPGGPVTRGAEPPPTASVSQSGTRPPSRPQHLCPRLSVSVSPLLALERDPATGAGGQALCRAHGIRKRQACSGASRGGPGAGRGARATWSAFRVVRAARVSTGSSAGLCAGDWPGGAGLAVLRADSTRATTRGAGCAVGWAVAVSPHGVWYQITTHELNLYNSYLSATAQ